MKKDRGFSFPIDSSGQWDGFNDSGIEHFSGDPFAYLGREVTQNALDATQTAPCKLRVARIDVSRKELPDVDGLSAAMSKCLLGADKESVKAKEFFSKAEKAISQDKLSVLQFSDFSTKGVPGPCENGSPFFALMKASGQSRKESGTATGSFGIGKYAPYTVSDLRTVFLSTAFINEKQKAEHYIQGKSILMSHDDADGRHRGTGFWGVKTGCMPVTELDSTIPKWLRRPEIAGEAVVGTTLSVVGFRPVKGWQRILAATIAESFFGAICRGKLEVEVEGVDALTPATLPGFFDDLEVHQALSEQDGEPDRLKNSAHYLKALMGGEAIVEDHQNFHLGHCRVHILVGESLPKRVAVLRNGMLITDWLSGLRRFGDFKEFVAVVECLSDEGNALLRAMEPPAHDDFRYARLPADRQQAGRIGLAELAKWVREMLKRHARDPVADVTSLDELADFFGDEEESANGARGTEENPSGKLNVRARPLKRSRPRSATETAQNDNQGDAGGGDDDGEGDVGSGAGVGGSGEGGQDGTGGGSNETQGGDKSSGGGAGGGSSKSQPIVPLRNVRAVVTGANGRRIAFTPDLDGTLALELEDSGADTNRALVVIKSSLGSLESGRIIGVKCKAGERILIDVTLQQVFPGTIRVKCSAV